MFYDVMLETKDVMFVLFSTRNNKLIKYKWYEDKHHAKWIQLIV